MLRARALAFLAYGLTLMLHGCATFPVIDAAVTRARADAPAPDLLPIEDLLAQAAVVQAPATDDAALDGRVAALKARAAALRRPVTNAATRARLAQALPAASRPVASPGPSG